MVRPNQLHIAKTILSVQHRGNFSPSTPSTLLLPSKRLYTEGHPGAHAREGSDRKRFGRPSALPTPQEARRRRFSFCAVVAISVKITSGKHLNSKNCMDL